MNALAIYLALILRITAPPSIVEAGYLDLYVKDATGKAVKNLQITCKGEVSCSTAYTDSEGEARLKLPTNVQPTRWVLLQVINRANTIQWALISPWDDRVNIPSYENRSENMVSVVVVRKGDRQVLRSGIALRALVERCTGNLSPVAYRGISDEANRIRRQQAEAIGLTPEELDEAIRDWAIKVKD